jgi:hypothetical protein
MRMRGQEVLTQVNTLVFAHHSSVLQTALPGRELLSNIEQFEKELLPQPQAANPRISPGLNSASMAAIVGGHCPRDHK